MSTLLESRVERAPATSVFDLAVLGGGPGGSAAAISAARRGLSVALFEPQRGAMDKPCGEGLLPEGARALLRLGLGDALAAMHSFGAIQYCIAGSEPVRLALPEAGLSLTRPTLMALLAAEVASLPKIQRYTLKAEASPTPEGYRIRAGTIELGARCLVVADGSGGKSAAWLRQPAAPSAREATRYGLRARFRSATPLSDVQVHLGHASEVYLTPLPHGWINVALLYEQSPGGAESPEQRLQRALREHPRAATHLGVPVGPVEARRLAPRHPRTTSDGTSFLVGDAGGSIDPILGCGLSVALESGIEAALASESILRGEPAAVVAERYNAFYAREVRARRCLAALLQFIARHPRLGRAIAALLRHAPGLARPLLGIAAGRR